MFSAHFSLALFLRPDYTYLPECMGRKIMARKTKEETENTKNSILQAALNCFYEKGFSKTTFDDIAVRIGMTKGAVYWHYKDKAELLADMIIRQIEDKRRNVPVLEKSERGFLSALRDFFQKEGEYIEQHPDLQKFFFFILAQVEWSDVTFNTVMGKIGDIRNFYLEKVQNILTSAQKSGELAPTVDVNNAALTITNLWNGSLHAYVANKKQDSTLTKTFFYGLDIILERLKKEK